MALIRFQGNRFSARLTRLSVLAVVLSSLTFLSGCPGDVEDLFDDEEECLVYGENCSQQYLEDEYGTTDIYCCEGSCADHGSGYLTCR